MNDVSYTTSVVAVPDLDEPTKQAMAALYLASYDGASEKLFRSDLAGKQKALLLYANGTLAGFTTLKCYERIWQDSPINVIYSGDTVVARAHWGQQALAFAWITYVGELWRNNPRIPLYWFLLVKGHRTFRYLPVFGKSFYPHWSIDRSDLKPLADMLALEMFPDDYNPATGVIEFGRSRGHLKPDIALPTQEELRREGVQFFLDRNPGFRHGHELVCLCEVAEANMKPLTLRLFRKHLQAG